MRKNNFCVIILFIVLFFAGCSQPTTEHYDVDSTGEFYSVGNLPVNQIVYRDDNGQYVVDKCYQNCIGFLMHVQGDFDGDTMYGKHLDIVYAEVKQ